MHRDIVAENVGFVKIEMTICKKNKIKSKIYLTKSRYKIRMTVSKVMRKIGEENVKMDERQIGFLVGMVTGILALIVLALVQKARKKNTWCEYDERQLQARGKAFQYGFCTLLFYVMFYGVLFEEGEPSWCSNMFGLYLGIGIALAVFGVYAIWNDAFMQLNQSPMAVYLLFGGVGGLNLILGIGHILNGTITENEKIGFRGVNLIMGTVFLLLGLVFAVKSCMDKREEE